MPSIISSSKKFHPVALDLQSKVNFTKMSAKDHPEGLKTIKHRLLSLFSDLDFKKSVRGMGK